MISPFESPEDVLLKHIQALNALRAKYAGEETFRAMVEQNIQDQLSAIEAVCNATGPDALRHAQAQLLAARKFPEYLINIIEQGEAALEIVYAPEE